MRGGGEMLIEGYASLFGAEDLAGDVVRAGAFTRTLAAGGPMPMLLQHRGGHVAGVWTTLREDGRGLFVRGLVRGDSLAGRSALNLMGGGLLDGLSIGFIARDLTPRVGRGRDLKVLELREISLVTSPMLPGARFSAITPSSDRERVQRNVIAA
jgi:HK97 family phage prohead protease